MTEGKRQSAAPQRDGDAESGADRQTVSEVNRLVERGQSEQLGALLDPLGPRDRAWLLAHLEVDTAQAVLVALGPEAAAELVHEIGEEQVADVIDRLAPHDAAQIVGALESDERADLLSLLPRSEAESILAELPAEQAAGVRRLLTYPADTAGGLMVTDVLRFDRGATVAEVLDNLLAGAERYGDYDVQYAYVVDAKAQLCGVLRIRDLLFARRSQRVSDVMIDGPSCVPVDASLATLRSFFEEHGFVGAPVVDRDGRLVGVVRRFAVQEALAKQVSTLFRRLSGIVGGDELRSMALHQRALRRLSWLSANIVLNLLAASVIAAHQETLQAAIVLAVFLPMISDMSGCSGNQAIAVSLRELTLGVVRPSEIARVLRKELSVGIINGVVLGALLGCCAGAWKGNVWLGLVVGGALSLNTLISVALGGSIPLLLRRMRMDPALASGPLLTTVTDMCGFFLVLSLAQRVLEHL